MIPKFYEKEDRTNNLPFTKTKPQSQILTDLNGQKDGRNQPVHIASFQGNIDKAINFYYTQVGKLYYNNSLLNNQLRAALNEKKEIADLIASFQDNDKEDTDQKKKRVRRCANEIERKYICQVKECQKSYGTEGSMAQHMKNKHPQVEYFPQSEGQASSQRLQKSAKPFNDRIKKSQ